MNAQEYARRYAAAQVTMVSREKLLLLMLEGGLKFLRLTRDALAAGDVQGFGENLSRTQAIIAELHRTLDHEVGGDISRNLARIYDFMMFHLTEANTRKSVRHVDEVIRAFAPIVDAFQQILARSAVAERPTAPAAV